MKLYPHPQNLKHEVPFKPELRDSKAKDYRDKIVSAGIVANILALGTFIPWSHIFWINTTITSIAESLIFMLIGLLVIIFSPFIIAISHLLSLILFIPLCSICLKRDRKWLPLFVLVLILTIMLHNDVLNLYRAALCLDYWGNSKWWLPGF